MNMRCSSLSLSRLFFNDMLSLTPLPVIFFLPLYRHSLSNCPPLSPSSPSLSLSLSLFLPPLRLSLSHTHTLSLSHTPKCIPSASSYYMACFSDAILFFHEVSNSINNAIRMMCDKSITFFFLLSMTKVMRKYCNRSKFLIGRFDLLEQS
jgi:hypothetical protein